MKVAILAGGKGARFLEETSARPKPMIEIGGRPILWHIMMHYHRHGFRNFVIALGYKSEVIKRWFVEQTQMSGSLRASIGAGTVEHSDYAFGEDPEARLPDWIVDLVETGLETNTGGRIKALAPVIGNERFMLTWGDGVSDVDLGALLAFHESHGRMATVTAVRPPARFGHLELDGDQIVDFREKPEFGEGRINGAFFVLEPEVFEMIDGADTLFEAGPLERLAREGQLMAFKHDGFWQSMDTMRDKLLLEGIWATGAAPWATWR